MVARERFELSSAGPKPAMLDHYTNGLRSFSFHIPLFIVRGLKGCFFPNKRSHTLKANGGLADEFPKKGHPPKRRNHCKTDKQSKHRDQGHADYGVYCVTVNCNA